MGKALEGRRIAITGATGFVGALALRRLMQEGAEVTALLRSAHGLAALRATGARGVVAPLKPGAVLARALEGAEVLVHLAYDVRDTAEANLAAFEALLAAATEVEVPHIVHASSAVVYDGWPEGVLDESSPIGARPAQGYRAAKIAMEERLLAAKPAATILQPTVVWGEGSELWTERPMRALRSGGLVMPEPCGAAPLLHVDDLAEAIVLAAALPSPGHERVLLTGPDTPGWDALFAGYCVIGGGQLLREPAAVMLAALPSAAGGSSRPGAAARLSALLRRWLGRRVFERLVRLAQGMRPPSGPLRPGRTDLALFLASPRIDTGKAARLLGWGARIGLEEGLRRLHERSAATAASANVSAAAQ